jgi:hypothetical protein
MEKCGRSGAGSPTATGKPAIGAAAQRAVSGRAANPDQDDHQFRARLGPAVFHGPQEIAQWRQSAAAPGATAAIKWPLFLDDIEQLAESVPAVQADAIQRTVQR